MPAPAVGRAKSSGSGSARARGGSGRVPHWPPLAIGLKRTAVLVLGLSAGRPEDAADALDPVVLPLLGVAIGPPRESMIRS